MKPIRLTHHAPQYIPIRGFTVEEVKNAITQAKWESTLGDRLQCRMNFPFGLDWRGKRYATKQVRPIFVDEPGEIVVVTVYVYYF